MISPSSLPSPAGYSFGSYEPIPAKADDSYRSASILRSSPADIPVAPHPHHPHDRMLSKSEQVVAASVPGSGSVGSSSAVVVSTTTLSSSSPSTMTVIKDGTVVTASGSPLTRVNSSSLSSSSSSSLTTTTSTMITSSSSSTSSSSVGATITTTTMTTTTSTTSMPSATFPKSSVSSSSSGGQTTNASLSVALCRSVVLKYIYLTYLAILQVFMIPMEATQKFIRRFNPSRQQQQQATTTNTRDVGAVGEGFVQQYTLDNHLGSSTSTFYRGMDGTHQQHQQQQDDGTYRLKRSSRFKSRSDLEEIAQSATLDPTESEGHVTTTTIGTGTGTMSMSLSSPGPSPSSSTAIHNSNGGNTGSLGRNSGIGSRPSAFAGYGTDSMAEEGSDATRRHFNARLRQRTGRPLSGLGAPGANGHGIGGKRKTLVLDLDETLIHATSRGSRSQGYMVEVLADGHSCLYYVYKRPHVDYFLKKVSEWYKLVIFTASMAEYADPVIDWLDSSRTLIQRRYFRQSCTSGKNNTYLKDLSIVEPDLSSVCLLDNSPVCYSLNKENGIPIDTWIDDPNDEALLDLLPFLDALRFTEDVRSVLSLRTI